MHPFVKGCIPGCMHGMSVWKTASFAWHECMEDCLFYLLPAQREYVIQETPLPLPVHDRPKPRKHLQKHGALVSLERKKMNASFHKWKHLHML